MGGHPVQDLRKQALDQANGSKRRMSSVHLPLHDEQQIREIPNVVDYPQHPAIYGAVQSIVQRNDGYHILREPHFLGPFFLGILFQDHSPRPDVFR
jgi:hypothetical protein